MLKKLVLWPHVAPSCWLSISDPVDVNCKFAGEIVGIVGGSAIGGSAAISASSVSVSSEDDSCTDGLGSTLGWGETFCVDVDAGTGGTLSVPLKVERPVLRPDRPGGRDWRPPVGVDQYGPGFSISPRTQAVGVGWSNADGAIV